MKFASIFSYKGIFISAAALTLTIPTVLHASHSNRYKETRLVANLALYGAANIDTRLVNPWGLTFTRGGNLVVADNGSTFLATSYRPDGDIRAFSIAGSFSPTGLETNHNRRDFLIGTSPNRRAARLLFATEAGTILAFNKEVNPTTPFTSIDRSSFNSVYKGLALGTVGNSRHQSIFAADFFNAKIDVFDHNFNFVMSFTDANIPAGFAPFNIQNFGGLLYVTYAKQNPPLNRDDLPGPGNGFVDIFDTQGNLVRRLVSNGALNSPWGLALAPDHFGAFSDALLVGNFGDGRINAYNRQTGAFLGTLNGKNNLPIAIDGLWSLKFSPCRGGCGPKLYFTSGPNEESDGLVGVIVHDN